MEPRPRRLPIWVLAIGVATLGFAATDDEEAIVVPMKTLSIFELEKGVEFDRGAWGTCDVERAEGVKAYPELSSDLPLFGQIELPRGKGTVTHDYAIDESKGAGAGYDRMYLDRNGNGDLTDDEPLKAWENPPKEALPYLGDEDRAVCFEVFETGCNYGEAGVQPVEIMPRLTLSVYDGKLYRDLAFIGTQARRGELEIDGKPYVAYLGHDGRAAGRYDEPNTALYIFPKGKSRSLPRWWGGDQLNAFHHLEGELYGFSASPTGDRFTVKPYRGKYGTFAVGAGDREVEKIVAQGSLRGTEAAVAIGAASDNPWPEAISSCQLPVGDYLPAYLTVELGELRIQISNNYHTDGKPRETGSSVYGVEIREDRPFVLDFHNEPDVLFASPAKDARVPLGGTLEVAAVLVDPELDIMIRGLDDQSRTEEEVVEFSDGSTDIFTQAVSLDPLVIITRANGEKVAQGDLPFG